MVKTMNLLRKYCLGDGPVAVDVISDDASTEAPSQEAASADGAHPKISIPKNGYKSTVNFKDGNFNVELPLFIIHGNHDDPGGDGNYSALDILNAAGLVNYFGRADNLEAIQVSPILLQKGHTKVGVYGLGNVRDERLHRSFQKGVVEFLVPEEGPKDWFNIMLIHQNRFKGAAGGSLNKNYIHETFLPSFLDLVVWGHEHECVIDPQESMKVSLIIKRVDIIGLPNFQKKNRIKSAFAWWSKK
eukprot:Filipodium_phascolosomae@DN2653_c0_g2_i1.p1